MNKIVVVLTVIVMSMLVACAQQIPVQTEQATPGAASTAIPASGGSANETTPEPTAGAPAEPVTGEPKIVTLDDRGKTIDMTVGESFLLKLGDTYIWEVTVSDQTILSRVKNIAVVRGAQGVYDALHAGTATLTATGDPQCRQSKPACAMPSILFEITVVVK